MHNHVRQRIEYTYFRKVREPTSNCERKACVVYLHSHGGCRLEAINLLPSVADIEMDFCCFDFTGSGLSEGEYTTLGFEEYSDIQAILDIIEQKYAVHDFILWGRSMGAVSAIMHTHSNPAGIRFLVLDSPFSDVDQMVRDIGNSYVVSLGEYISSFVFGLIKDEILKKVQIDFSNFKPIDYCCSINVPCIFLAASEDKLVIPERIAEMSQRWGADDKPFVSVMSITGTHTSMRQEQDIKMVFKKLASFFPPTLQGPVVEVKGIGLTSAASPVQLFHKQPRKNAPQHTAYNSHQTFKLESSHQQSSEFSKALTSDFDSSYSISHLQVNAEPKKVYYSVCADTDERQSENISTPYMLKPRKSNETPQTKAAQSNCRRSYNSDSFHRESIEQAGQYQSGGKNKRIWDEVQHNDSNGRGSICSSQLETHQNSLYRYLKSEEPFMIRGGEVQGGMKDPRYLFMGGNECTKARKSADRSLLDQLSTSHHEHGQNSTPSNHFRYQPFYSNIPVSPVNFQTRLNQRQAIPRGDESERPSLIRPQRPSPNTTPAKPSKISIFDEDCTSHSQSVFLKPPILRQSVFPVLVESSDKQPHAAPALSNRTTFK